VSDAGLVQLKGLTMLSEIQLENTQVTDAGLEHIRGLSRLESLALDNTQVTDSGIAELQRALPALRIER
jgi:hypothetical protein